MKKLILLYLFVLFLPFASFSQTVKILFDATKAETAGNADWVIDADAHNLGYSGGPASVGGGNESNPQQFPTPLQSTITSTTAETYWQGSLSSWGIDLVKLGYEVEELAYNGRITYGDNSNAQDLSNYKVFIVDEPNILFTTAEKTALLNFVSNGGGLFMISDHVNSDRNNDGHDSPSIWNDFMTSSNNAFGITWALNDFSQTSTNFATLPNDTLLHGPYGNPVKLQYSNGSSLKINPAQNSSVVGVVYVNGCSTVGDTGVMMCHARYGNGKVVATGDSSPMDDGTGDPNDQLYNGWTGDASGNHEKLIMNATIWLAETSSPVSVDSLHLLTTADTTLCAGSPITMKAAGSTSYSWSPGGATTASITVTPSATALYIVAGTTGSTTKYDTVKVTVDAFSTSTPQITAGGPVSFCAPGSVTLTAPDESHYHWSNGTTTQSVTASQSGTYNVSLTDANGCGATSNTVTVTSDAFAQTTPQISASGPLTFCGNSSVTLTAPAQTSYRWSNGLTTQSITVNTSGSYTASITDANACQTTSNTVSVSADAFSLTQPQITANGPLSFCTGGSVVLSAPAGYAYHWNNSTTQQSVTVNQTGTYSLTVTDANNCSAKSDTALVSVSASITGVQISPAGAQQFCSGSSITLSAPSGYSSYHWSSGSTAQSISVSQQGQYYVSVSSGNTCNGVSDTTTVSVDNFSNTTPQLTASGPLSFCQGDSISITATGANSYLWNTGSTQQAITVSQTGIFRATVTDANNCSALSQPLTVLVHSLPQVNFQLTPDSICSTTGSVLLQGTPAGGSFNGTGVNGTLFEPAIAGTGTFAITYNYTDSNSCSNSATSNAVVYICTGIQEFTASEVSVYPNPSSGIFIFETEPGTTPDAVKIFNGIGEQIIKIENTGNQNRITIDLKNFATGIYTAVLSQNNLVIRKKLVKVE